MIVPTFLTLLTLATCFRSMPYMHPHHLNLLNKRQDSEDPPPAEPVYSGPMVPSFNISIPIDHFNDSDTRTYNNRYWVNDTYYQSGGPIFLVDNGEVGVSNEAAAQWLAEVNGTSTPMALARQYNGLVILWEHRYYGLSLPFPVNDSSPGFPPGEFVDAPASYAYLTVEQSLEDVAYFANNLQSGQYQREDLDALAPSLTPWVMIGASYPGMRAAWMRIRNPEVIYASWSSSAPVQSRYDGSPYFDETERSIPSNCTTDSRAIIAYADELMAGDHANPEYLELERYINAASGYGIGFFTFNPNGSIDGFYDLGDAETYDEYTIASFLRTPFYDFSQTFGPALAQQVFCSLLQSYNPDAEGNVTTDKYLSSLTNPFDAQPNADGFLAANNNNLSLGIMAFTSAVGQYQHYALTQLLGRTTTENPPNLFADLLTAYYQVIVELGWFHGSNPDNITVISSFINYTAVQQESYFDLFTDETRASFPAEPQVEQANSYGGWNMNPSNVMFTDGEFDPWRAGSVHSREDIGPGNQPTADVPACGVAPENGTRYGAVYPDATHGWDLFGWSDFINQSIDEQGRNPQQAGIDLFVAALDVWLPCFNSSRGNGTSDEPATYTGSAAGSKTSFLTMLMAVMLPSLALVVL